MLLAALALLPLAGLVYHNAVTKRQEAAALATSDVLGLVLTCENDEELNVESAEHSLDLIAELPDVKRLDWQACGPLFGGMIGNAGGFENLGLVTAAGQLVASAKPVDLKGPIMNRTFFKKALAGRLGVSDFEMEPSGKRAEMICGEPVWNALGQVVGVVFAELNLDWMTHIGSRLQVPDGVTFGVVNSAGIVVMRVPDAEHWIGRSALDGAAGRTILQRQGSGTADEEGLDHVRRLFAYAPLDPEHGLGSFVSAGIPDEIAFSPARRSEQRELTLLGMFALGAFLAAWFAADILVLRGVRMLLRATQKVAAGDLRTRAGTVPGGGEFRELSQAFDTMATSIEKQSEEKAAAAQELERRVEERTAELEEANAKLQQEVAERSRIEAELRVSSERLNLALKGATDGIWDWDLVTGQMYFSPRWKEMLGYGEGEIGDRFKEWESRLHPEDRDRALEAFRDYLGGKRAIFELEHRLRHKDGSYRWILSRGVAVWDEEGKPKRMAGSHVDLTERRRAEQALRESESKLRAFINNVPAILFSIDRNGVITLAEGLGMDALRQVEGGIVGHTVTELYGDTPEVVENVRRALAGESLVATMDVDQMHYEVAYSPIHSPDGTVTGVIGVAHDITERIRAKKALEATAAELRRSNEELEQFAYIASHDLQEPLRMVASYTQLLERRYAAQLDDAAREFIGYAVDGAKRMQLFIAGLLAYSRVGTERREMATVNIRETFEAAVANLRIAIEESGATVEARDLPVVRGDPRQLTQVLQNLIGNALKFRKPGTPPRIEAWGEREGDASWRISVRDNGIGLDPRFSERVFTIFQRLHTRDEYEGTGLGLAICKKIVERHGGRIWVESKEGEGAAFSFTLPIPDPANYDPQC